MFWHLFDNTCKQAIYIYIQLQNMYRELVEFKAIIDRDINK